MDTRSFNTGTGLHPVSGSGRAALYGSAATRQIEQQAASTLPHHTLMSRAGLAVARLARSNHTDALDRAVFRLVDSQTGEVVRQIPSAEVLAIARALAEGTADAIFHETKLATGRYYMARHLPATGMHLARILSGAEPVMALAAEQF